MDIAGGHVALSRGQRSQPYPNLVVSCQHETSFLSNQSDPAQLEPHRHSLSVQVQAVPARGTRCSAPSHTHISTCGDCKRGCWEPKP